MGLLKDVGVIVAADALEKVADKVDKLGTKLRQPRYEAACNADMKYMLFARQTKKHGYFVSVSDIDGKVEYTIKQENKVLHKPAIYVHDTKKHELARAELIRNRKRHGYLLYLNGKEFGVIHHYHLPTPSLDVQYNGWKMESGDPDAFWYAYNKESRTTLRIKLSAEGSNTDIIEFNNPMHTVISLLLYALIDYRRSLSFK